MVEAIFAMRGSLPSSEAISKPWIESLAAKKKTASYSDDYQAERDGKT